MMRLTVGLVLTLHLGFLAASDEPSPRDPLQDGVIGETVSVVHNGARRVTRTAEYQQHGNRVLKAIRDPDGKMVGEETYEPIADSFRLITSTSLLDDGTRTSSTTLHDLLGRPVRLTVSSLYPDGTRPDDALNTYKYEYQPDGRIALGPLFGHQFTYTYETEGDVEVITAVATRVKYFVTRQTRNSDGKLKEKTVTERYFSQSWDYSRVSTEFIYDSNGRLDGKRITSRLTAFRRDRQATAESRGEQAVNEHLHYIYGVAGRLDAIEREVAWSTRYVDGDGDSSGAYTEITTFAYKP